MAVLCCLHTSQSRRHQSEASILPNGICEAAQNVNVKSCMALLEFGLACTSASLQLTLPEAQPAYQSSMQVVSY